MSGRERSTEVAGQTIIQKLLVSRDSVGIQRCPRHQDPHLLFDHAESSLTLGSICPIDDDGLAIRIDFPSLNDVDRPARQSGAVCGNTTSG